VTDVMALPEAHATTRKATAAVAMVQRTPQRRRNRAGPGADLPLARAFCTMPAITGETVPGPANV
jgi:hypothetical protein